MFKLRYLLFLVQWTRARQKVLSYIEHLEQFNGYNLGGKNQTLDTIPPWRPT